MFFRCFSPQDEDFRPKRLVYNGAGDRPAPPQQPQRGFVRPEKKRDARESGGDTRSRLAYARDTVIADVRTRMEDQATKKSISDLAEQLSGQAEGYGAGSGSWKQWNEKFEEVAKSMGIGKEIPTTEKVAALQRVVFGALHLTDSAAVVDGKLGPYTLAALARYAKIDPSKIKVPEGATALAASVAEYAKTVSPSDDSVAVTEQTGKQFLMGRGLEEREGGVFALEKNGVTTYFKLVDGRWMWASATQKEKGEWKDVGTGLHTVSGPDDPLAEVNALSVQLAQTTRMQSVGARFLGAEAESMGNGVYAVKTGDFKTYFKFENGKWMMADDATMNMPNGWTEVGAVPYTDPRFAQVNELAERLKRTTEAQEAGNRILSETQLQADGSYMIERGGKATYFKFVDGRWKWASQSQKNSGNWQEVSESQYEASGDPNDPILEVNRLADSLARAPIVYRNPYHKPAPTDDEMYTRAQMDAYYTSVPGREPGRGPKLDEAWKTEYWKNNPLPNNGHISQRIKSPADIQKMNLDPRMNWRVRPDTANPGNFILDGSLLPFPEPTPAELAAAASRPQSQPKPLIPADASPQERERLSFLDWDPSKVSAPVAGPAPATEQPNERERQLRVSMAESGLKITPEVYAKLMPLTIDYPKDKQNIRRQLNHLYGSGQITREQFNDAIHGNERARGGIAAAARSAFGLPPVPPVAPPTSVELPFGPSVPAPTAPPSVAMNDESTFTVTP